MKQFFKILFASMLGTILGTITLFILLIIIVSLSVSSLKDEEIVISENSILHLKLDFPIHDRSSNNPFENFNINRLEARQHIGLNDILKSIKKASKDPKIKGIYIDVTSLQGGIASIDEIRNALLKFRKSGKFVVAFADYYTQGAYYLASASDHIYLNPEGSIALTGLSAELLFFKGTLEKLEVEPQVIRHGKYKSAIEPFILDKMSDENRSQIAEFVDPIWSHLSGAISTQRNIDAASFKTIVDSMKVRNAGDALRLKLVDKLAYYDEFAAELNKKAGKKAEDKLPLISLARYRKTPEPKGSGSTFPKNKIAVIYATGAISNGDGNDEQSIGSDKLSAAIRDARKDEKVKAIVLRVNSPGGDALASEEIWREVSMARKAKPTIVSMGDMAASGGYYISCAADKIVVQENTLTGSIGVFGILFNAEKMLKNKLGITADTYKTNPFTDMGTITRPLTASEKLILQQEVDRVYQVFTKRVAEGRKLSQAQVDSIGQGRVWAGVKAIQIGLADTLGGLETAIDIAARKAGISDYRITQLPEQKDPFQSILEDFSAEVSSKASLETLGVSYQYLDAIRELLHMSGVQALSPYRLSF